MTQDLSAIGKIRDLGRGKKAYITSERKGRLDTYKSNDLPLHFNTIALPIDQVEDQNSPSAKLSTA